MLYEVITSQLGQEAPGGIVRVTGQRAEQIDLELLVQARPEQVAGAERRPERRQKIRVGDVGKTLQGDSYNFV